MTSADPGAERFLITGAAGCIGAWTVAQLVREGTDVVALDLSADLHRLKLLLCDEELERVPTVRADITDLDRVTRTLDEHEITHVIHLAALQVPFCRADPPLGARVNVVGTVNLLEAVARRQAKMAPLIYASSIATYEGLEDQQDQLASPTAGTPGTLYGVYKRANEGAAVAYWRDRGLASVGLRPHTVYGPGRDQGLTSAPTVAMLAAAAGEPFRISFGGRFQIQYARDVAGVFIRAARTACQGATVHNLAGHSVDMREVVEAIEAAAPEAAGAISHDETVLPFPEVVDASSLAELIGPTDDTPLQQGVSETIDRFRKLLAADLIRPPKAAATPLST